MLPCYQDPAKRPDAKMLQQHEWLGASRRTLRASWQDTLRGRRPTPAMEPVSAVVDATLRDMADPVGTSSSPTRRRVPGTLMARFHLSDAGCEH